jgi:hypothetical protein
MEDADRPRQNPMQHPEEQPTGTDGAPRFGILLVVLACAVAAIVAITFGSAAWFAH